MGICYSQQQQWQAYKQNRRDKNRRRKKEKNNSVIYEQKTIYESSFASEIYASFRQDLHHTISQIANENGSVFMGSIVEMKDQELDILYKSLHKISPDGYTHLLTQAIILCNLKTKNYLHTHKIKYPEYKLLNEVSCCPYNSNHIAEYDIWKFIKVDQPVSELNKQQIQDQDEVIKAYIYHPFTQRFLNYDRDLVVGSEEKKVWTIYSFGKRRNGGFVKIFCEEGQLCMSEHRGLLEKHRKLVVCQEKHVSHIWEIMFIESDLTQ